MNNFYRKIDKIAKLGSENFIKYYSFVDDCIERNQYWLLSQVLYHHYNFDVEDYLNVGDMKRPSWSAIMKHTVPSVDEKKAALMVKKGIYQLGVTYYEELPVTATYTNPLGTIQEIDYFEEDVDGLSPSELQKIVGNKKTYLVATLDGSTMSASFSAWRDESRYDKNLINLYKEAFDYLV